MSRQKVKRWQGGDKCYSRGLTSQGHRAWAFQLRTFQRTKFRPTGAKWLFNETVIPDIPALEKRKRGHGPSLEHDKRAVVFTYIHCDPINRGREGELVIYGKGRKRARRYRNMDFLKCIFSASMLMKQNLRKKTLRREKRNPGLSHALRFNAGSTAAAWRVSRGKSDGLQRA